MQRQMLMLYQHSIDQSKATQQFGWVGHSAL